MLRKLGEFTKQTYLKLLIVGVALLLSYAIHAENAQRPASTHYEQRTPSRDGIGKFYMGREISHVMGHQGAEWLERPEREREEMPTVLVELLKLKEGDVVADIGVGTGYIARRISRKSVRQAPFTVLTFSRRCSTSLMRR